MKSYHGGRVSSLAYMFFFFNDTATTEIYTLSLHDALPISAGAVAEPVRDTADPQFGDRAGRRRDRKSTRLNSSHLVISYAVFCLKKKKNTRQQRRCSSRSVACRSRALLLDTVRTHRRPRQP